MFSFSDSVHYKLNPKIPSKSEWLKLDINKSQWNFNIIMCELPK